jgi:lysophospholipase L1-like esterase
MPAALVVNKSISGNTIGFDNLGRESLNTLKNINRYLTETTGELAGNIPDIVIIGLGTNDCKSVFAGKHDIVIKNMNSLIDSIQDYYATGDKQPDIVLMTPPPMTSDSLLIAKYKGGNGRIEKLVTAYRKIASSRRLGYIDLYNPLKQIFPYMTNDGVHLIPEAQIIVARYIKGYLDRKY